MSLIARLAFSWVCCCASVWAQACESYQHQRLLDGERLRLCWTLTEHSIQFELVLQGRAWLALGLGGIGMVGADTVIGKPLDNSVLQYDVRAKDAASITADAQQDLSDTALIVSETETRLRFRRALNTGDPSDYAINVQGLNSVVWAYGKDMVFAYHVARGLVNLDFGSGQTMQPSRLAHGLHGVMMVLGWGVLLPCGVLLARFFKVTHSQNFPHELDNPFWWNGHRLTQYSGIVLVTFSALIAYLMVTGEHLATRHAQLGTVLLVLGWFQVINAWLRGSKGGPTDSTMRGDHYDMTRRRRVFEVVHKLFGYCSLLLSVPVTLLGLDLTGAGTVWYLMYGVMIAGLVLLFILFHYQGRQIDTYVAIWGHPYRRMPAGQNK